MKFPYWYHQISMESNSDEGWLAAARTGMRVGWLLRGLLLMGLMVASEQRIFRGCSLRYGQHQETTRRYGWTREFVSKTTSSSKCRRLDHLMTAKRPGRLKTWSCRQKTTKSASPFSTRAFLRSASVQKLSRANKGFCLGHSTRDFEKSHVGPSMMCGWLKRGLCRVAKKYLMV